MKGSPILEVPTIHSGSMLGGLDREIKGVRFLLAFVSLFCPASSCVFLDRVLGSGSHQPQLRKALASLLGDPPALSPSGLFLLSLLLPFSAPRPRVSSSGTKWRVIASPDRLSEVVRCPLLWFGHHIPSWVLLFTISKCHISCFS